MLVLHIIGLPGTAAAALPLGVIEIGMSTVTLLVGNVQGRIPMITSLQFLTLYT